MKKAYLSGLLAIAIIILPITSFAAAGRLVAGPTGNVVNGWYTENALVTVNGNSTCAGSQDWSSGLNGWGWSGGGRPAQANEGIHSVKLVTFNDTESRIYLQNDGAQMLFWGCNESNGTPPNFSSPVTLWEGIIKWDVTAPTISISSPANNSNTDSGVVVISGIVNDNASGVQSVVINGVKASIAGSTFKASIPVNNGLNTLSATVTDVAGHTAQAQVVVNRIATLTAPATTTQKPNSSTNVGIEAKPTDSSNNSDNIGQTQSTETEPSKDGKLTQTQVLGVVKNTGTGIFFVLLTLIVILLLDKYKVIVINVPAINYLSSKLPWFSSKNKK